MATTLEQESKTVLPRNVSDGGEFWSSAPQGDGGRITDDGKKYLKYPGIEGYGELSQDKCPSSEDGP